MSDPVTRAAKRQNLLDRLAEHLHEWGCPPDSIPSRTGTLLLLVESHGWLLPTVDAPPLSGRGSTDEGRRRARLAFEQLRAGCRCGADVPGTPPDAHLVGCPVREPVGAQA